jgi:hypothetical protein
MQKAEELIGRAMQSFTSSLQDFSSTQVYKTSESQLRVSLVVIYSYSFQKQLLAALDDILDRNVKQIKVTCFQVFKCAKKEFYEQRQVVVDII